ncbi:Dynein light chain type 1/2 [Perkinsela sp. CCAP 1560/4]|nr:Dynein light chain type 1/2 [Perkinsela sp. CCAP 1560/4]|eukprot:KNH09462.1 Dynein light chain type 1/2 [Perkinsela sp. CCAP 1560/4]
MSDKKPIITVKSTDMTESLQQDAREITMQALEKHTIQRDIAKYVKKHFDELHGPTWHCIVGRNFGSFVTHEDGCFIYFYVHDIAVLLFRAG